MHLSLSYNTAAGGSDGGDGGTEGSEALGNADAARAVLRVKQKLEGVAGGEGEPLGVEAQVGAAPHRGVLDLGRALRE